MIKSLKIARCSRYLVLVSISMLSLFPFIWAVSCSFKGSRDLWGSDYPSLLPRYPTLANFEYLFGRLHNFPILLQNSILVTFTSVIMVVIMSSLAGYAFARLRFKGRDAIFLFFIVLMFIPHAGGLIALYELMFFTRLTNSLFGLTLVFSSGLIIPTFLMRQVFLGIPKELEDAARVDGASNFRIFLSIMAPLARGGMVLVAIMTALAVWGEYLVTWTLIDETANLTLAAGCGEVLRAPPATESVLGYGVEAAGNMLTCIPVLILFIIFQKWFVKGAVEGLKL